MRGKKKNQRFWVFSMACIIFYIALIWAYYLDLINAFIIVGVLSLALMISWVFLFRNRHDKAEFRKTGGVVVLAGLLFVFDLSLLQYEQLTFRALVHEEPVQAAENSGIHLMSVGTGYYSHVQDKEWLVENFEKGGQDYFQINEVDNKTRFLRRNNSFLQLIGMQKDEASVMAENVKGYLEQETAGVEKFLASEGNSGDSAGLGLALTGLIEQNKLRNDLEFAVTGAMDEQGEVGAIGMIKEKLMIAEKTEFPYMIIPGENADEAEEVKEMQNLDIQIFAVSHIDEAVELITRLNEEAEE